MVVVGKGHGVDGNLVARDGELTIDLLRVLLVEEEGNGLGVGGSSPTKKVRDELVEEDFFFFGGGEWSLGSTTV